MKPQVDVCLSPELIHLYDLQDKLVVIVDILRATTCMVSGIANGVSHIMPFADLETCRKMKDNGYIIAGERGGQQVEGFDIGNSPYSYLSPDVVGKKIAVTTTNGTRAVDLSKNAPVVILGAFLNLDAVADHVEKTGMDVLIFCAGWKGRVNLEDTLFAGALAEALLDREFATEDDATLLSTMMYRQVKHDLEGALANSSHVNRLKNLGIQKDIQYSLQLNTTREIPVLKNGAFVKLT